MPLCEQNLKHHILYSCVSNKRGHPRDAHSQQIKQSHTVLNALLFFYLSEEWLLALNVSSNTKTQNG